MFRITYRKLNGQIDIVSILAVSESIAREIFYHKYDGRIISIDQVASL